MALVLGVILLSIFFIGCGPTLVSTGAKTVIKENEDEKTFSESWDDATIKLGIKAFISVDLFGNSCNSKALRKIADESNILFIEDAAEALGTEYQGKHIGNLSDAVTFSFFDKNTIS